ncbi:MAG: polyprenyl synthetase family protein [Eubacterium sp.]|nr:polyprenyl synthetase family protein [Eubacterium sp.]
MYTPEMKKTMNEYVNIVNEAILDSLPTTDEGQREVIRAMRYSLANGGKRLRPVLVLEFCKMCGGDYRKAIPLACAIEYIHTYSLIHDDLPCMDDDDMRRGAPSCHVVFGQATALLAGDALLTHAFELIADSDISDDKKAKAVSLLAQNAGVGGMIGGQALDLKYENMDTSVTDILTIHKLKTGALISAACILGCIAAGADDKQIEAASRYAYYLGLAFQIKDDLLDIEGDEEELGKPVGSDAKNEKTTYVTLVGEKKANKDVRKLTACAINQLEIFPNKDFIILLSDYLISRNN